MNTDNHLITLCQELLEKPSFSGNEEDVAHLLASTMQDVGFDEVVIDSYGSVVGTIRGNRPGRKVLLDGHIDTVGVDNPEAWQHPPFGGKIEDGKLYGRGSSDMKSSVACMLMAASRFAQGCNKQFAGSVHVSCTVHEECFEGISSRLVSALVKADCVIIGEATSQTIKRGQRGRCEIVVETEGLSCHSSNPEKGINAIYLMMELLEEIRAIKPPSHPILGKGILELTDIVSSPYPGSSVVPNRCRATFDRRTLVGENEQSVLLPIEEAIQSVQKRNPMMKAKAFIARDSASCWTGETIEAKRFFPAWLLEEDHWLVESARKALPHAELSHFSFCTNGSHYAGEAQIPTIGFGPSREDLAHVVDEYCEIEQILSSCKAFQDLLFTLLS